jgi:hypothetical protein
MIMDSTTKLAPAGPADQAGRELPGGIAVDAEDTVAAQLSI